MANHLSAKKRNRQNITRRERNKANLSRLKTLVKRVYNAANAEEAEKHFNAVNSYLDKLSMRNNIHRNTASRKKRQLALHINKLQSEAK